MCNEKEDRKQRGKEQGRERFKAQALLRAREKVWVSFIIQVEYN